MSGTCSLGLLKAGTCMAQSMPKVWATAIVMSGKEPLPAGAVVGDAISVAFVICRAVRSDAPRVRSEAGCIRRGVLSDNGAAFQSAVGEVHGLEALLRRLVAAIGIGVELLGQRLVAAFDLFQCRARGQRQFGQRLLVLGLRPALGLGPPALAQDIDIVGDEFGAEDAMAMGPAAERPSRPLPHRVAPDDGLDLRGGHAGVVVPGAVVVAHMVEAEPVVVVHPLAGLG